MISNDNSVLISHFMGRLLLSTHSANWTHQNIEKKFPGTYQRKFKATYCKEYTQMVQNPFKKLY